MKNLTNKQGNLVKSTLVRTFVPTGEMRTPLVAVWSLLTEAADEAELLRPVSWEHLLWKLLGRRAFHFAVIAMA